MSLLSEVEPMDTLPFAKESTPTMDPRNNKRVAPSIEQVTVHPDELRMLRGQGRYFGLADEDAGNFKAEPKCNNCSQRGHFKRDCPHVICTYCGSMNDHYSQQCPKTIKCSNCNENGHYKSKCPKKWKRVFCTLCNSKIHSRDRCPSVWRVYLLKGENKEFKKVLPMHNIFCYNCGSKGHFGDDCSQRRSSRVPLDDGSAFSGDNLCNKLKKEYFQNITDNRNDKDYYDDDEIFDYNDYEYNNEAYDDYDENNNNRNKRKPQSKKRKFSNFNPPPYQNERSSKKSKPSNKNKEQYNSDKTHPLDFPRNKQTRSNVISIMNKARYDRTPVKNKSSQLNNYKSFNSFKFKK